MSENTKIEWTDATFNPWIGCTQVGPGCDNCYAAQQDKFRSWTPEGWGGPRKRTSAANWAQPAKWNALRFFQCNRCGWRGSLPGVKHNPMRMGFYEHPICGGDLVEARQRVFCASLADVFDNQVDPHWRADLFALINATPNLDWLLLTKRIGNVAGMVSIIPGWLPANVWLGATIVNQEEADRDIPKLIAVPAHVHFLSMEPLLGPVDISQWLFPFVSCGGCPCPDPSASREGIDQCCKEPEQQQPQLQWVIAGGESGPGARPSHPDWYRSLRDQCAAAGVSFLFKQWGEWAPAEPLDFAAAQRLHMDGTFEGVFSAHDLFVKKVGKKAAGRLLDGIEHNGFPS